MRGILWMMVMRLGIWVLIDGNVLQTKSGGELWEVALELPNSCKEWGFREGTGLNK